MFMNDLLSFAVIAGWGVTLLGFIIFFVIFILISELVK